jgi:GT2 family glycosyltransferase
MSRDVQPHNIHDRAPDPEGGKLLKVSVVIPAYNRGDLLAVTLESLARQRPDSPDYEVHVADDGSDEDLASVVASAQGLDIHYHRREHDRFGAGQARNLGAAAATGDVLVFLDSDCVVEPGFVLGHAVWHTAPEDTVVIGGRTRAIMGSGDEFADYRKRMRRRTAGLQHGSEVFRSFVTANVSLPLDLFRELGGFDERFHRWGGEDTDLGWRLWNKGATFIDDEGLSVRHQIEEDFSGGSEGRRRAHELNMGLIKSLIPHRFYRKGPTEAIPESPKVSVVLHDVPAGTSHETWEALLRQPRSDFQLIVVADPDDEEPLAGGSAGDPRLAYTETLEEAARLARGEYTCFLDGHGAPAFDLLTGVVNRLDKAQMTVTATVGYALPADEGGPVRSRNGAADVDAAWGSGMPLCWFIRTREINKLLGAGVSIDEVWDRARAWGSNLHWTSAAVRLPGASRRPRPRWFTHRTETRQELATDVVQRKRTMTEAAIVYMRSRKRETTPAPPPEPAPAAPQGPPRARYIGWAGHHNLGDEVMLDSVRSLLPWAEVETTGEPGRLLILGGGTLINRSSYLRQVTERDSPRVERCVLGTGVANPDYWGELEDPAKWVRWLSTCAYLGVRGPYSRDRLVEWGLTREVEICGDSALSIEPPEVKRVEGRVVFAPAWTKGKLWGGSDEAVVDAFAAAATRWHAEGREIVALASSPDDDGQILQIMQRADIPLRFVQGYLDTETAIETIAAADLVVGERLHACVIAAAVDTPFIPIEYRPKLRDFAASVGVERLVVRTDEIAGGILVARAEEALAGSVDEVRSHVDVYRRRLRAAADLIERAVKA